MKLTILVLVFCFMGRKKMKLDSDDESTDGQSCNWVGTLNNYTEEEYEALKLVECKYMVMGKEIAPTTGTPHLQMHFSFHENMRLSMMKNQVNKRAWWHVMNAKKPSKSINYCKEDGVFFEKGTPPMDPVTKGSLEKDRWAKIRKEAEETGVVTDDKAAVMYERQIENIHQKAMSRVKIENLPFETKMKWYFGETGTGKSRAAYDEYPDSYTKELTQWWSGYTDQEVVIIDDIDTNNKDMGGDLKRWADIRPFNLQIKGVGARLIRPKMIVVTSNFRIRDIWPDRRIHEPLERRFVQTEFRKNGERVVFNTSLSPI